MLGVMANGWTWYRDPWVWDEFDRLANDGFFKGFDRVAFYGASMGGYAACAFAAASPGCEVVAISPQSTLDKNVVPWETRYKIAWDRDFSGAYGDAATASRAAQQVTILFDPYEPLDRGLPPPMHGCCGPHCWATGLARPCHRWGSCRRWFWRPLTAGLRRRNFTDFCACATALPAISVNCSYAHLIGADRSWRAGLALGFCAKATIDLSGKRWPGFKRRSADGYCLTGA
jgi:hypothetical protein